MMGPFCCMTLGDVEVIGGVGVRHKLPHSVVPVSHRYTSTNQTAHLQVIQDVQYTNMNESSTDKCLKGTSRLYHEIMIKIYLISE